MIWRLEEDRHRGSLGGETVLGEGKLEGEAEGRGVRWVSGWLPSAVTVGVSAVEAWEARAKDF